MDHDPLADVYSDDMVRAIDGDRIARARLETVLEVTATGDADADGPGTDIAVRSAGTDIEVRAVARRRVAGTAMAVAAFTGVRDALENTDDDDPIEIIEEAPTAGPLAPVEVMLVPYNPTASLAIVRPWLLPSHRQRLD